MPDNSFDVVSKIELAEVSNAVQQALKEITQRYDLKDSKSNIELNEKDKKLVLASQDEYKLKAVTEIVKKIKDSKLKVQASIQGDLVRVSGKDRDTLQSAIKLLRESDFGIDMQFTNYRTN